MLTSKRQPAGLFQPPHLLPDDPRGPCFGTNSHAQLLIAEIEQGMKLLAAVEDCAAEPVAKDCALYAAVLSGEGVASFSDPEARWGFKKKDEPFLGYKVHVACDETGIVSAVKVTPGNEAELAPAKEMVDDLEEKLLKAPGWLPTRVTMTPPFEQTW